VNAEASERRPENQARTISILVVDDERSVRDFVRRVLEDAGYRACIADSGPAALRVFGEKGTPDLLLTDLNMPGMRGDELVATMRKQSPDLKVLYLTGFADELFTERTTLWENETYLDKPSSVKGLLEAVSMALYGHLLPDANQN
jgi:two-component system cell cycle sensor histidine kinase/response regulator CckA